MTGAVASFLFAAAWKGTLLVAFALVVHRVARNRVPSRWLCALLLVAIVRLLIPVAPPASFSVFNLVSEDTASQPTAGVAGDAPMRRAQRAALPTAAPTPEASAPWIPALLALWAAGVLFAITRATVQTRRFQRQLAGSVDVARDDVRALVDECRGVLSVRRRVRIVTTSAVATPSLHGWLRPALLLPEGFLASFTREQLRYVVLHELAHLRRSDVLINWIATAARALHWFNPLVRLAVARLAEERELACDALALAALRAEERPAYGGTVLELVDRMRAAPAVPALVGMTATPEQLKRRIVMIASFRQSRFSIVFAALVVAVGLVTLTDARAGEPMKRREMKMRQPASPAVQEVMRKLETKMNAELTSASLDDVLHALMNATGVTVVLDDGAVDDATRAKRLDIKAKNVPAHLVLFESLGTLDLAVKITETGVLVLRPSADEEMHMRAAENEATRTMVRKITAEADGQAGERRRVEVSEDGERGGGKRKLTFHDGAEEGTLEIEVVKE
ncbi:MAG: M56 family metallopeptidase [Thermoanaerobaculia bacterium]